MKLTSWKFIALFVLLALPVTVGLAFLQYLSLKGHLQSGLTAMSEGVEVLTPSRQGLPLDPLDLSKAESSFARAEKEFGAVHAAISPVAPVLESLGWAPKYGAELAAAPRLIEIAVFGSRAARRAVSGLNPTASLLSPSPPAAGTGKVHFPTLLSAMSQGTEELAKASESLDKVAEAREQVSKDAIRDVRVLGALDMLDSYLPTLRGAVAGATVAPGLLGYPQPKRYLLLLQNNHELRATGGFIGGAAVLTLSAGDVSQFEFRDSYDFDRPDPRTPVAPPPAYSKYMLFQDWSLRDSNWWPDFPTSAKKAMEFLKLDSGQEVDGVIAVDQEVILALLKAFGPISAPLFKEIVTSQNFMELANKYAHPPGYKAFDSFTDTRNIILDDRKAFLGYLGEELLKRLKDSNRETLLKLAPSIGDLFAQKHIMIYLDHPEAARTLKLLEWDGSVADWQGDFLMVVDSNVGYSKSDPHVKRSISYRASLEESATPGESVLRIHYANISKEKPPHCSAEEIDFWTSHDSCYKNYVRVYVPKESAFIAAEGLEGPVETYYEDNKLVMAGLMVLGPGSERDLGFRYIPPRSVVSYQSQPVYGLFVQKQAGTDAVPFSFELRLDSSVRPIVPESVAGRPIELETSLKTDFRYSLPLENRK